MIKKSLRNQKVENRLSARNRLKTMVKVVKDDDQEENEIENYSLTGLFFKCNYPQDYEINDKVEVSFIDKNGIPQQHTGQVVRKTKEGVAVHYQSRTHGCSD